MKPVLFITAFLLGSTISVGQDEVTRKDDSLQRILHQPISDSLKVKILEELHFLWKNKNYIRSIDYCKQAIEFSEKHKSARYTRGLRYQLAFAYMEMGYAVPSLEIFHQILQETEGVDPLAYSTALSFIGMNYENQGDLKTALEYHRKACNIYDDIISKTGNIDRRGFLGGPHRFALLYLKSRQLDSALFYGLKGLDRLGKEPLNEYNRYFSWEIKATVGDIYAQLTNYALAEKLYDVASQEATFYNYKPDQVTIYLSRAKLCLLKGEVKSALEYAKKTYALADTLKLLPMIKEVSLLLKKIYLNMHMTDEALLYSDIYMETKDSMLNADVARKMDAMKFSEEKRSQELKTLQQEKSFRDKQYLLLTGTLLSIIAAVFFYHKNRLKQKANQLLEYQNKEIFLQRNQLRQEVESFEMQALKAQLNPHFIFNCLNCIDAFIYSNDKYKATIYLNKFAKLLRNILDSSKNNTVSLSKDIQSLKLYTDLEELRNENKFETHYQVDEQLNTGEYAVPPLIIQPLVENAILHGLKNKKGEQGVLLISIQMLETKLKYQIIDNGIGRQAASKIPLFKEQSYGMELTEARIKLFNGEDRPSIITEDLFDRGIASGTRITVLLNFQSI